MKGGTGVAAATYQYVVSSKGTERAREAMARNGYIGPAPVTQAAYVARVRTQSMGDLQVTFEQLRKALGQLVLPEPHARDTEAGEAHDRRPANAVAPQHLEAERRGQPVAHADRHRHAPILAVGIGKEVDVAGAGGGGNEESQARVEAGPFTQHGHVRAGTRSH